MIANYAPVDPYEHLVLRAGYYFPRLCFGLIYCAISLWRLSSFFILELMDPRAVLSNLRKKRGHIKGLITRQANHIQELERAAPSPETTKAASELLRKVRGLDDDYKKIHFDILECINEADKDALDQEQENFSTHDDQIEACCTRINKVMHDPSASDEKNVKIIRLKLRKLKGRITSAQDTIAAGGSTVDSAC